MSDAEPRLAIRGYVAAIPARLDAGAGPAPVQHERQLAAVAQAARWPTSPSPTALAAGAADRSRAVAPGVDKAGEKVALPVEDLDGFAE